MNVANGNRCVVIKMRGVFAYDHALFSRAARCAVAEKKRDLIAAFAATVNSFTIRGCIANKSTKATERDSRT